MTRGSTFEVLQNFCFKYANIFGELMLLILCINFFLVELFILFSSNIRNVTNAKLQGFK